MKRKDFIEFRDRIANILFESQEFYSATNSDPGFKDLDDDVIICNGDADKDEIYYLTLHKIDGDDYE